MPPRKKQKRKYTRRAGVVTTTMGRLGPYQVGDQIVICSYDSRYFGTIEAMNDQVVVLAAGAMWSKADLPNDFLEHGIGQFTNSTTHLNHSKWAKHPNPVAVETRIVNHVTKWPHALPGTISEATGVEPKPTDYPGLKTIDGGNANHHEAPASA